jgi:LPXTG-motif cell wall-anchored protein
MEKSMRITKLLFAVLGLALLVGVLASLAIADTWNKKTVLTFSQPVEIPGVTLPAGTYVFKLADIEGLRHIVKVWNADETKLLATVLAIPNYRLKATEETATTFYERPVGAPVALRAWFYPGDTFGQAFVYPKTKATQLAQASKEPVPAEEVLPTESTMKTVPLFAVTPEQKQEPIQEAFQVGPSSEQAAQTAAPAPRSSSTKLPQTGSSVPLFGLLGLVAVFIGITLKLVVKLLS